MKFLKNTLLTLSLTIPAISSAATNNVGDVAASLTTQMSSIGGLVVVLALLMGLALIAMGALQLKKHSENPQQVPLSKPIIWLVAGGLLTGLSSTSSVLQGTLTDGGQAAQDKAITEGMFSKGATNAGS